MNKHAGGRMGAGDTIDGGLSRGISLRDVTINLSRQSLDLD